MYKNITFLQCNSAANQVENVAVFLKMPLFTHVMSNTPGIDVTCRNALLFGWKPSLLTDVSF